MANRVFQGVVYQMKDAIDRMVGVVDETGTIISCSDLNRIGEVRDGIASDRLTAGDAFVRDGYTYHLFSSNKRNDYAVLVEGTDEPALRYAALLAISLQNIKQYHDEKFDKANFIKNVVLDLSLIHISGSHQRFCGAELGFEALDHAVQHACRTEYHAALHAFHGVFADGPHGRVGGDALQQALSLIHI